MTYPRVTYGGQILATNGDRATFGGNAQVPPKGQEQYQDHGPAADLNVHSINVQAVTCSTDGAQASIFGQATVNGSGTFDYRIDLEDVGEPGTGDTYRIRLSSGYDSGEQVLVSGNVQIHYGRSTETRRRCRRETHQASGGPRWAPLTRLKTYDAPRTAGRAQSRFARAGQPVTRQGGRAPARNRRREEPR